MRAIIYHETRGVPKPGQTGEVTSLAQWLPATWESESRKALGYVAPINRANEEYVLVYRIQGYLNRGYTPYEYALIHNGGEVKEKKGWNTKHEKPVWYDTKAYALTVTQAYAQNE